MKARKMRGEGWDVFESIGSSDGEMQICKVDDPGSSIPDDDPRWQRTSRITEAFKGDAEAVRHVLRRAKAGDKEAIDALWLVLAHDGLVNRILWAEADPRVTTIDYPEGFNEVWPQFAVGDF